MPQVILALPAYNEAACIGDLLEAARKALENLHGFSPRVIVSDDDSDDGTADIIRRFEASFPVEVVHHAPREGLGPNIINVLHAALERSTDPEDVIVNMDADNTHPPDVIPAMLRLLDSGIDVVIASRYQKGSEQVGVPPFRLLLSWGARWLFAWRLRLPGVRDYTCGYRAYHAKTIRRAFDTYGDHLITRKGFACTDDILVNIARLEPRPRIAEVPFILRYDRKIGQSKLPLFSTIMETVKLLWGKHS